MFVETASHTYPDGSIPTFADGPGYFSPFSPPPGGGGTGVGLGVGSGVGLGVWVGFAVGLAVGDADGSGVGDGDADGSGVGDGDGDGLAVGVGSGLGEGVVQYIQSSGHGHSHPAITQIASLAMLLIYSQRPANDFSKATANAY